MGTAQLAQCPLPALLTRASKSGLGCQVCEIMREMPDDDRRAEWPARSGATVHDETIMAGFVRKLSDEEWLAQ